MAGSLIKIDEEIVTTAVNSISLTGIDSTYDVYKIVTSKVDLVSNGYQRIRFISSGGVDSSSVYDTAFLELTAYTAFSQLRFTNDDKIYYWNYSGNASSHIGGSVLYVFNPFNSSSYTFVQHQTVSYENANNSLRGDKGIGVQKTSVQNTGINFFPMTGNYDNITVNVYGVK